LSARRAQSDSTDEGETPPGPAKATLEGDRALLDAFRRGEKEALAAVFRMYVADVAKVIRAGARVEIDGVRQTIGGDLPPWDVENVLQETFVRAFAPKARASYDGVRPFGGWVITIARNLLIDRARRRKRESERVVMVEDVDRAHGVRSGEGDPLDHAEDSALRSALADFVESLDEADRKLFRARYDEQRSLRDAARHLGISLFTLRRKDARLRLRLLEALREAGFLRDVDVRVGKSVLERGPRGGS
jgi:RNA polymerase sigma-70 factor (ECF subfamily)